MTAADYKAARELRGSQASVAAKLGVAQNTISRRELGLCPINGEAAAAMLSLPTRKKISDAESVKRNKK